MRWCKIRLGPRFRDVRSHKRVIFHPPNPLSSLIAAYLKTLKNVLFKPADKHRSNTRTLNRRSLERSSQHKTHLLQTIVSLANISRSTRAILENSPQIQGVPVFCGQSNLLRCIYTKRTCWITGDIVMKLLANTCHFLLGHVKMQSIHAFSCQYTQNCMVYMLILVNTC